MNNPFVLEETDNFAVVFKPPKMHTSAKNFMRNFTTNQHEPSRTEEGEQNTLFDWYTVNYPPVFDVMHRLDYETHGLVLFAKNEKSFNFFKDLQDKGGFVKEYSAICTRAINEPQTTTSSLLPSSLGFPPCPLCLCASVRSESELVIESYFRPYGPGRKLVRPVIDAEKKHKEIAKDKSGFYRTEIINIDDNVFTVRIKRGFRHQIRCHLCWIGFPIHNDPLYSFEEINPSECGLVEKILTLRAHVLFFTDPATGNPREYGINPLNSSCLMPLQQLQKDLPVQRVK